VVNILNLVDSIEWASNDMETWWEGHGYCDVAARIKDMSKLGLPGSAAGISIYLATAAHPNPSQVNLRHNCFVRNGVDVTLSFLLPLVVAMIHFALFQVSRYHITGVQGCTSWMDASLLSLLFFELWPPILCLVAAGYACTWI